MAARLSITDMKPIVSATFRTSLRHSAVHQAATKDKTADFAVGRRRLPQSISIVSRRVSTLADIDRMPIEYINRPPADRPYSGNRLTLLDADVSSIMAHVLAIDLIENGDRSALEFWQKNQLTNLLRHPMQNRSFGERGCRIG